MTEHLLPEGKVFISAERSFCSSLYPFVLASSSLHVAWGPRSVYKVETSIRLPDEPEPTLGRDVHICFAYICINEEDLLYQAPYALKMMENLSAGLAVNQKSRRIALPGPIMKKSWYGSGKVGMKSCSTSTHLKQK